MDNLKKIWGDIALTYSKDFDQVETFWSEIVISYSDPMRVYHNLDHVQYVMDQAVEYQDSIEDFDAMVMAIIYHDIVYNSKRKDNEESSAALARFRLGEMLFPSDIIERSVKHILATKEHVESADPDTNWMVDFDLAILGEIPEVYELYREKLRREYRSMSDAEFNKGREELISLFLKKERIYVTEEYYKRYEERARGNLGKELAYIA